jgi:hypothetical protein
MKRCSVILVFLVLTIYNYGQKSVDRLFEKYSDGDGFVTLTISGNLLQLFRNCNNEEKENILPAKISGIRLLIQDDEGKSVDNFYETILKNIDRNEYEEFMRVKESDQDLIMLVKTEGRNFREFLLIGGGDDNLLIQIKGNMTLSEARKFSSGVKKDCSFSMMTSRN